MRKTYTETLGEEERGRETDRYIDREKQRETNREKQKESKPEKHVKSVQVATKGKGFVLQLTNETKKM